MHGVRPVKPIFALTLIVCAYLAPVLFWPHAVNTAAGAEPDTPPAAAHKQAAGKASQPRSALFEALEIRASEDAARQIAGAAEAAHRDPGMAWDRERAFAGMERLRAGIVVLGGLRDAQRELLQWNRERIKTGRAPALLPARLCREVALAAWCPLLPATFGVLGRAAAGSTAMSTARSTAMSSAPAAENTPPAESGNAITKDELQ